MRKLFLMVPAFVLLAAFLGACGGNDKPPLTPDSDGDAAAPPPATSAK
jgi:hypothetical protein